MNAGTTLARPARARHRHELRTLTYVTLDQANGGVIRNLSRDGIAAQVVAAVRPRQQMRVRFELRYPKLRVEARGEVMWATFSGQCGIRFLDLSPRVARQIDEWIFGNLLEGAPLHSELARPVLVESGDGGLFSEFSADTKASAETDSRGGLVVSAAPVKVIELAPRVELANADNHGSASTSERAQLDWLSQPLSGRSLAWTVNALAVVAALLLFVLIFLSITREPPRWPWEMILGGAIAVAALYWGFFRLFGGPSPGTRLARLAGYSDEEEEGGARFR